MEIELTTKVDKKLMEQWLSTQENKHIAAGHVGTHLDTYNKSAIPLEYFKNKGVLLDVSEISEEREIEIADIAGIDIPQNSFVLIRTARSENKAYGTTDYFSNHPQLSQDLIDYLLSKKIRFIGIDCSGIRRGDEHEKADRLCESKGVYVIENLTNLDKLVNAINFKVYALWFNDEIATGLPCRIIADIEY
jgi:kynurenine formamidase